MASPDERVPLTTAEHDAKRAEEGAPPLPAPVELPRPAIIGVHLLYGMQFLSHVVGIGIASVVARQRADFRDMFNLGDRQVAMYCSFALLALGSGAFELYTWRKRVRANGIIRLTWYTTLGLAGGTLPAAGVILASETPSRQTLNAAWAMSAAAVCAATACFTRRLLVGAVFRPQALCEKMPAHGERFLLAAPIAALAALASTIFGVSVGGAARPRALVVALPQIEAPFAAENKLVQLNATSAEAAMLSAILHRRAVNPYANVERDAMTVEALFSALAAFLWFAAAVGVARPDRFRVGPRRLVMAGVVTSACALQAVLFGTVFPGLGVLGVGSTRQFANEIRDESPTDTVSWYEWACCPLDPCLVHRACVTPTLRVCEKSHRSTHRREDPLTYAIGSLVFAGTILHQSLWPADHHDAGFRERAQVAGAE